MRPARPGEPFRSPSPTIVRSPAWSTAGDTVDVFVTVRWSPDDVAKAGKYYTDKSTKVVYQNVIVVLSKTGTFYVLKVPAAIGEEINHLQASGAGPSASPCARRTTSGRSTLRSSARPRP